MCWDTESTARATVTVPNVGEVSFRRRFAGSVTLFPHWDLFLEYGTTAKDVQTIATRLSFRF